AIGQDVDGLSLKHVRHSAFYGGLVADIDGYGLRALRVAVVMAACQDQPHRTQRGVLVDVSCDHAGAGSCELQGACLADAAACTGDKRSLATQEGHFNATRS